MSVYVDRKKIHQDMEYQVTLRETENNIRCSLRNPKFKFSLDTNRLVILAQHRNIFILRELLGCDGYISTATNITELKYQSRDKNKYDPETRKILEFFWEHVNAKYKYHVEDYKQIEKEIKPFTLLIPRKLVSDVMISCKDSYLHSLIEIYTESTNELKKLKGEYMLNSEGFKRGFKAIIEKAWSRGQKEKYLIETKVRKRFEDLCKQLNINEDEIDKIRYFASVENHKENVFKEIFSIIKMGGVNFETLVKVLKELMANKRYTNDIKLVAETLAKKAIAESNDDDVKFLFEVHSARRAA